VKLNFDDQWAFDAFVQKSFGGRITEFRYFDPETVNCLEQDFAIEPGGLHPAQETLELMARVFWQEEPRRKADYAARRKELTRIEVTARKLHAAIADSSDATWQILSDSALGRTLGQHTYPRIVTATSGNDPEGGLTLEFEASSGEVTRLPLEQVKETITALATCASNAKTAARAGKSGPVEDDGIRALMLGAALTWGVFLKRDFRLDWQANEPVTEAARFCQRVARVAAPEIEASRIVTGARFVRETPLPETDLGKLFRIAAKLSKRLE